RPAEVPHTKPTYALRVEWRGSSLCYSADCAPNDVLPELARGCDVLLAECSYGAGAIPAGVPHLDAAAAGAIARRAGVGRLLLTHCYPEYDRDAALAAAAAAFGGPVAWAREGEEGEVGVSPTPELCCCDAATPPRRGRARRARRRIRGGALRPRAAAALAALQGAQRPARPRPADPQLRPAREVRRGAHVERAALARRRGRPHLVR